MHSLSAKRLTFISKRNVKTWHEINVSLTKTFNRRGNCASNSIYLCLRMSQNAHTNTQVWCLKWHWNTIILLLTSTTWTQHVQSSIVHDDSSDSILDIFFFIIIVVSDETIIAFNLRTWCILSTHSIELFPITTHPSSACLLFMFFGIVFASNVRTKVVGNFDHIIFHWTCISHLSFSRRRNCTEIHVQQSNEESHLKMKNSWRKNE